MGPNTTLSSPTSSCQVVSLPRLPSTRSLARRVTLGTLLSSSWVLLLRPPMFPRLQMSLVRSTRSQAVVFVVHKTSATLGPRQTSFMIHLLKLLERPLALRSETKLIRHSIHSVNGSGINSSGINSSTANGNGYTNGKVANGNTTLGQNNPVLSGSV